MFLPTRSRCLTDPTHGELSDFDYILMNVIWGIVAYCLFGTCATLKIAPTTPLLARQCPSLKTEVAYHEDEATPQKCTQVSGTVYEAAIASLICTAARTPESQLPALLTIGRICLPRVSDLFVNSRVSVVYGNISQRFPG